VPSKRTPPRGHVRVRARVCVLAWCSLVNAHSHTSSFFLQSEHTPDWLNLYLCGAGMEMYTQRLSPSFTGQTFTETAK
jgi:hypothetical protein